MSLCGDEAEIFSAYEIEYIEGTPPCVQVLRRCVYLDENFTPRGHSWRPSVPLSQQRRSSWLR